VLEPWEREILHELFLIRWDGSRWRLVYSEALIGLARKNGKSTLASVIALYLLVASGENAPEVYAAAAAKDQAQIVFKQARDFVEASPRLREILRPLRNVIECESNKGIFRVLSSDAPKQHGLNPNGNVIDELWAHENRDLYDALTTADIAREDPLTVSITTAGFDRESVCFEVYERGKALEAQGIDAMRAAGFFFKWYAPADAASADDREAWMAANPSSWITEAVLARQRERLPEFVFRRLHMNQWTAIEDAWVSPDEWDRCAGSPKILRDEPVFVGVDIGIKRDATALVWVQWRGDKLHVGHHILLPTKEQPISAKETRVLLKRIAARLQVREVPHDPWQFRESAEELAEEGLPMEEFPQYDSYMGPASEALYELVREQRLVHNGDPLLREQILGAVAAATERGWRISKRKSKARIDGCVALAMAAYRAVATRNVKQKSKVPVFL
jgi:phage terminase large subunit-like protein